MTGATRPGPESPGSSCPVIAWSGEVFRAHNPRYTADDSTGSRLRSGRYNCGEADAGAQTIREEVGRVWEVLYYALGRDIVLGEMSRHVTDTRQLTHRLTRLAVRLQRVLDCRDAALLGMPHTALWIKTDYRLPQRLALAAFDRGIEALLVPSATLLGDNLIVFKANLSAGSSITILDFIDPDITPP